MLHDDDDFLDAADQVHGAAHALDQLAGDHPVGHIAVLSHLHGAHDGEVDMAAADHAERIRRVEIARGRQLGDGLLAGIDEIGIFVALVGERAEAEHAVLRLQLHAHPGRDVVRHQGRNTDAEIDVEAVLQFLGGAFGHLVAGPGHDRSSQARLRTVRCSMYLIAFGTWIRRWTKMPGVMMWSGLILPGSTRFSTSATVTLPAVAITGLKLRAVLR